MCSIMRNVAAVVFVVGAVGCVSRMTCDEMRTSEPQYLDEELPVLAISVPVKFRGLIPSVVHEEDRVAIEDVLGRIPALGRPVIVDEVITWPSDDVFVCGVACAIGSRQVFLVKTTTGKWWLSKVIFLQGGGAPRPTTNEVKR